MVALPDHPAVARTPSSRPLLPAPTSPTLRLNTICPYYTMFDLAFPWRALEDARPGSWVLDPFCGRGTTIFAARLRGLPAVGVDISPVAAAIASAKVCHVDATQVSARLDEILDREQGADVPEGAFWRLCFHPTTLASLCQLRASLRRDCVSEVDIVLRALVMGILHGELRKGEPTYLSNQMPRTYATKPAGAIRYWTKLSLEPPLVDLRRTVARRAQFSLADLPPQSAGFTMHGDSRTIPLGEDGARFDRIVTSPPYYGMYTYYPDQWLRAWFLGGPPGPVKGDDQIGHGSADKFAQNLALVWTNVANAANPGAQLVIRFGSLPSAPTRPLELLSRSIELSTASWRIIAVSEAGTAKAGRRQADQFREVIGEPVEEIDLIATLET